MNRVFVDLDGVVVDFDGYKERHKLTGDEVKRIPGAYLDMQPVEGALAGVASLIGMGWEVWVATKPPTGLVEAYADKVSWVLRYLPDLKRRIILTHDKGLLGDAGDVLIDDRPHKANCEQFKGLLIPFVGWHNTLLKMAMLRKNTENRMITDAHDPLSNNAAERFINYLIWGGGVVRYHTHPMIKRQMVAAHSQQTALIADELAAPASLALLRAALHHDMAEQKWGDTSSPVKKELGLTEKLDALEGKFIAEHIQLAPLTDQEHLILRTADRFSIITYCIEERRLGNRNVEPIYNRVRARYFDEAFTLGKLPWIDRLASLLNAADVLWSELV